VFYQRTFSRILEAQIQASETQAQIDSHAKLDKKYKGHIALIELNIS
jgi:hypothetical protein